MGASWKTTLSACVSAGASFVLFASQPPFSIHFAPWLSAIAMFAMVGGLTGLGIVAKDSDVTGGTVSQPGIPVAPVPPVVAAPAPPVPPTATTGFGSTTMASGAMLGHGVIPPAPASATVTTNKKW